MAPNTICSVCSISKLFTSVAIMNLYEDGLLRLDDEIGDLLPEFDLGQRFELSGPITIRNLLTHSSGFPRENAIPHWTDPSLEFPTKEQILEMLNEQETLYPSSTYFQYSNLAMIPETKMAYSVMINSSNPNPGKYTSGIHGILSKAGEIEPEEDVEITNELAEYAGYYRGEVMKSTSYVGTWGDKLMMMGLPANDPGEFSTY